MISSAHMYIIAQAQYEIRLVNRGFRDGTRSKRCGDGSEQGNRESRLMAFPSLLSTPLLWQNLATAWWRLDKRGQGVRDTSTAAVYQYKCECSRSAPLSSRMQSE